MSIVTCVNRYLCNRRQCVHSLRTADKNGQFITINRLWNAINNLSRAHIFFSCCTFLQRTFCSLFHVFSVKTTIIIFIFIPCVFVVRVKICLCLKIAFFWLIFKTASHRQTLLKNSTIVRTAEQPTSRSSS